MRGDWMLVLGCGLESSDDLGQRPVSDETRTDKIAFKVVKVMVRDVATSGGHVPSTIYEVMHLCGVGIAYDCKCMFI